MKSLVMFCTLLISSSSFAYTWIECKSRYAQDDKYVALEIDRYTPSAPYTNMRIFGVDHGEQTYFRTKMVSLITPSTNFYEMRYFGSGVDLKIDTFPDQNPHAGNLYSGAFADEDLFAGMKFTELRCEYLY